MSARNLSFLESIGRGSMSLPKFQGSFLRRKMVPSSNATTNGNGLTQGIWDQRAPSVLFVAGWHFDASTMLLTGYIAFTERVQSNEGTLLVQESARRW